MEIRHTKPEDLPSLLAIYQSARAYMAATGNPRQWGQSGWPPEDLVREDIEKGRSFCVLENGKIGAVFVYLFGKDIDPTYRHIERGSWMDDSAYGVIHRFAGNGSIHGVGGAVFSWAFEKSGHHLRVDTHPDNRVMQSLLQKNGFVPRGIIHVTEDPDERIAYEKTE